MDELKRELLYAHGNMDELRKSSVTLSTQLETLSQKEADTWHAKEEAEDNIVSLTEYVEELKSR